MAKDPAFLFYPGDYLRDTQMLSEKAQVAYDRIMCEHMRNICISQQQLNFLTKRLNEDEKNELMEILVKTDDGFYIEWVALSITKRKEYSKSRSQNRKGNSKKDMINISKTYVKHMENENENENVIINNINKVNIENEDLWTTQKNLFLNDFRWNEKFCRDKNVLKIVFDKKILDFVNEIELRNEWKDKKELQRHFVNWFKKNNNNGKSVSEQRMDAAYEYANRYAPKGTAGKAD